MKPILLIGVGGIGSWLVKRINWLMKHNQLPKDFNLTIYDPDYVENKNLNYQCYDEFDLTDPKVFAIEPEAEFIERIHAKVENEEQLNGYETIICAVDNSKTRELVFKFCHKNQEVYFIDLRAEGSAVWAITSDSNWTLDQLLKTLNKTDKNQSCQLPYDLEEGRVQLGNIIIAEIGTQFLLNHIRGKKNPQFTAIF